MSCSPLPCWLSWLRPRRPRSPDKARGRIRGFPISRQRFQLVPKSPGCASLIRATALVVLSAAAQAQDSGEPAQAEGSQEEVVSLDTVRVTAPRRETLDLYRFKNPIDAKGTRFERSYRGEYSLEQLGKDGGLIAVIPAYLAGKVAEGVQKLPGYKHQIQHATARPPPLTEAQMKRAERATEESGNDPQ